MMNTSRRKLRNNLKPEKINKSQEEIGIRTRKS